MNVKLQGVTVTVGRDMGDEGTGYNFLPPNADPRTGDFSRMARGHYRGRDFAATGELDDRMELKESQDGRYFAYAKEPFSVPVGKGRYAATEAGLDAGACIAYGLLTIKED